MGGGAQLYGLTVFMSWVCLDHAKDPMLGARLSAWVTWQRMQACCPGLAFMRDDIE